MNPETQTHVLKADGATWTVRILETESRGTISIESDPPTAVMSDTTIKAFLDPILKPFEGGKKPVLLGNKARGWAVVAGQQGIVCDKSKPLPG